MVRRSILSLLINAGSFAWLGAIRKVLFDYFDIYIPLNWWTIIPAVIIVIIIDLIVESWIEKGVISWK